MSGRVRKFIRQYFDFLFDREKLAEEVYQDYTKTRPECLLCGLPVDEIGEKYFGEFCSGSCESAYKSVAKKDRGLFVKKWRIRDLGWLKNYYLRKSKKKPSKKAVQ